MGLLYRGGILFESEINSISTSMTKVQFAVNGELNKNLLDGLEVMSFKIIGSVATAIIKGEKELVKNKIESLNPIIMDFLPLTLEEVFIYEMEVLGYEFNQVL